MAKNTTITALFEHVSGFAVTMDGRDMNRWLPEDIMPRLDPMLDLAAKTIRVKERSVASQEIHLPIKGKPDAVVVVVVWPPKLLHQYTRPPRGVVWIGLKRELKSFWREVRKSGPFDRFNLSMPADPHSN